MNYYSADTKLYHKGHGGKMDSRVIANNTLLERDSVTDDIHMRYHATRVVTFHSDGSVTLRTGGWWTYTTKERLNWVSGISVYSDKRKPSRTRSDWFVRVSGIEHEFQDGMRIDLDSGWLVETIETYA